MPPALALLPDPYPRVESLPMSRLCLLGLLIAALASPAIARDDAPPPVSFARQVLPILQRKCQGCHQPAKRQGKLDLTSFEAFRKGGDSGPGFEPGKTDASGILDQIDGDKPLMPPIGPAMTGEEVDLVKRWIVQGATDDTPPSARDSIDADHPPIYAVPPLTTALAFSPDGRFLAISGYREVLIHKADGSGPVARLVGQSQRIESLVFSPDGSTLAAVGGSPGRFGEVQFWDANSFKLKNALRTGYDTLYGGAFTPDGKHFAFGCADNSARIVEVEGAREVLRVDQHSDWVFATAFSRDGKHLITLGRDGSIKLVEAATGAFIDDIGKNYGELKVLARHPTEDRVVIGGDERVPRLYQVFRTRPRDMNYTDFNLLKAFEIQPGGPISAVAIAPDGASIAVGGSGGEVRVYKTDDGAFKAALKGFHGSIFAIAFAPDGKHVAIGGFDGTVRIYDPATGGLTTEFVPVPLAAPNVATNP